MKKHKKKILIFLITIAIIGSVIYIQSSLKLVKAYTYIVPNITDAVSSLKKLISGGGEENIKAKIKENIYEKSFLAKTSQNIQKFKKDAFNSVRENINEGLNVLGNTIGVPPLEKTTGTNNCNGNQ